MNIKQAFQIFDLNAESSPEALKKRYHDLAAIWHPDLHAGNSRLQEFASEKMKEINSAYETLRLYMDNHIKVACEFCGAETRKRRDVNIDYATCSACGKQLRKPLPKKKRIPCGNHRCAGTIGSSGRCNYCGKTIGESQTRFASGANNQSEENIKETLAPSRNRMGGKIVLTMVGISILVVAYAYHRQIVNPSEPSATPHESAALKSPEPISASNPIAPKAPVFRSSSQTALKDDSHYSALFDQNRIKKEAAQKIQQILKTIGYDVGKPDGLVGNKTISCLKQYGLDFNYLPQESFPDCFFVHSLFHYQISLEHKDWLDIFLTNDLENWVRSQPVQHQRQINALALDQPSTAIQLVRRYKFEKFKPIPTYFPETGVIKKRFPEGSGHLKIKTKTENNNYYVKLINYEDHQESLAAFIRSGSTLSVQLPPGAYELRYAAGPNWYGMEYLFGTSTSYGKLPMPVIISEKTRAIGAVAVELIPSQHGSLKTNIISEYDF
jgi:hypothetical protein